MEAIMQDRGSGQNNNQTNRGEKKGSEIDETSVIADEPKMADKTDVQMAAPDSFALNPTQLDLLKSQMMAFKLLAANAPLPAILQDRLKMGPYGEALLAKWQDAHKEAFVKKRDKSLSSHDENIQMNSPLGIKILFSLLQSSVNNSNNATSSHQFPMIVSDPMDPTRMILEYERIIKSRVEHRIAQLSSMPLQGLGDESTRLKATIELKALSLLEKQRKVEKCAVRRHVLNAVQLSLDKIEECRQMLASKRIINSQQSSIRPYSSMRQQRLIDRNDRYSRMDPKKADKERHARFVSSLVEHAKSWLLARAGTQQKTTRMARAVLHAHTLAEREEAKRADRLSRERLNALKADDEDAYMKLLDAQKDTRLTHLLRQTDSFLSSLAARLQAQKESTGFKETAPCDPTSNSDYYATAHAVTEALLPQPSMLVGGQLKEYQLRGVAWMISLFNNHLNGILADEMGLGKTIQTIALISYLIEYKQQNGPYLVIVPLSTMTNWSHEFEKWAPSVVKVEYKGTPIQRKSIQQTFKHGSKMNVLLTTYEYIIKDKSFLSKIPFLYMIIDEGHRMKNTSSKLSTILCTHFRTRLF